MPPLFDSHCHFDHEVFNPAQLWPQCQQQGIKQLLIPATTPNTWHKGINLAEQYTGIYTSAGLHPWHVEAYAKHHSPQDLLCAINLQAQQPKVIAIGECGLDKLINCPIDTQLQFLQLQIQAANKLKLPIILHNVKMHNALIQQLKKTPCTQGGILHAFNGSYQQALEYWQMGYYLGVGGSITYERAKKTRTAIQQMPLESLVLETDAPDMPLSGLQGQPNNPLNINRIAVVLSELKNISLDETYTNCYRNTLLALKLNSEHQDG